MTGSVHTGSNEKFRSGWDAIFHKKSAAKPKAPTQLVKQRATAPQKSSKKK